MKMEARNGSFIKPKNYLLSDGREPNSMKIHKKWSGDDDPHSLKEMGLGGIDPILSGLVVENKSSKAYSKLLKPPAGRGACIRR
jgi:hypothetical protein